MFGEGMFGRFFAEPVRAAGWIARYNQFFNSMEEIERFDQGDYQVRVYKTSIDPPQHRVGVRFGNAGEVIELLGYEQKEKWIPQNPLRLKFYWRFLKPFEEPLELSLRLFGSDDEEIGSVRGDVGPNRREGVFVNEWQVPIQAQAEPGLYRLEVNLTQTRFAYRLPMMTSARSELDKLFVQPLKLNSVAPSAADLSSMRPASVRWERGLALRGYGISTAPLRPGDSLSIRLYWETLADVKSDYTLFVHLHDNEGRLRAQLDTRPRRGAYPTSIWEMGELITDEYSLELAHGLPLGDYTLSIGWYEHSTLSRLAVFAERGMRGDQWTLPVRIQITQ